MSLRLDVCVSNGPIGASKVCCGLAYTVFAGVEDISAGGGGIMLLAFYGTEELIHRFKYIILLTKEEENKSSTGLHVNTHACDKNKPVLGVYGGGGMLPRGTSGQTVLQTAGQQNRNNFRNTAVEWHL